MTRHFIKETANIDIAPLPMSETVFRVREITIGDLHSNVIKLLYYLMRQNIIFMPPCNYTKLVEIYKIPLKNLRATHLLQFKTYISAIQIRERFITVRLIGDELADRGANDYYILEVLRKLNEEQMTIEIIFSNHGAEFIEAYERFSQRGNHFQVTCLGFFAVSLMALDDLVDRQLLDVSYVFYLIENCYKKQIKLLSYSISLTYDEITIYSHAGIDLKIIQMLASIFNINYQDKTLLDLASTINQINQQFQTYIQSNNVYQLLKEKNNFNDAIQFIIWNRSYEELNRPKVYSSYKLNFVHGHDSSDETSGNIYNLDNLLGKALTFHKHIYTVLLSDESQDHPI